jgi:hypothetical protein
MLELRNRTPYTAAIVPGLDREGQDFATIVIKATFSLASASDHSPGQLPLAEEPMPIVWADEFYGEPDSSSMKYESDTSPARGGTDVVLVGNAYAPRGRTERVDVHLQAGPISKTVRVFGDRRWSKTLGFRRMSRPKPFEVMPLVYERAFGGSDLSHRKEKKHAFEKRNPVGTGFTTAGKSGHFDDLALPNLEDPAQLISKPKDKPRPAGFGFVARHWEPRVSYVGTYDDAWMEQRCPLLPLDFDERHFRSAHPDLCAPAHFSGGEEVRVRNASRDGELRFAVPGLRFEAKASVQGEDQQLEPRIDTILIEPDEQRVAVTWKATLPCSRRFLLVEYVRIRELERFA